MDALTLFLIIVAVAVVLVVVFALMRRSRRSGTVLAANPKSGGRQ